MQIHTVLKLMVWLKFTMATYNESCVIDKIPKTVCVGLNYYASIFKR